ncbi:MAG: tRNA preQ1(34) S-adenosylmethionine ribosyltransferase-isomerase QueA, partial [Planctomycetota bacterium]
MNDISDYDYHLPEERIAQIPADERSGSRLMVLNRSSGRIFHKMFPQILSFLQPGDALVLNNTKVIPARIPAHRASGGAVEIFLLHARSDLTWSALARPTSRLKEGERLTLDRGGEAILKAYEGNGVWTLAFDEESCKGRLSLIGRMPLPHYIKRGKHEDPRDGLDRERYQTVYSEHPGAVAAPTAGLHFTQPLLDAIRAMGVHLVTVTLHVGIGTFAPVREQDFTLHAMHTEKYTVTPESAETLNRVRSSGGRIVAVGTTSARVLETLAQENGMIEAKTGETGIYIYPPYRFRAVDLLLTNFHLPKSTLLLLISAFSSRE